MEKRIALDYLKEYDFCVGAYVNNKISSLTTEVTENDSIKPILLNTTDGQRIYKRSLLFLLYAAFGELYPDYILECSHSIYRGEYVTVSPFDITEKHIQNVVDLIHQWSSQNLPIEKLVANEKNIQTTLETQYDGLPITNGHFYIYKVNNYSDYSLDIMVPSCGYINNFTVQLEDEGLLVLIPKKNDLHVVETPKKHGLLASTFKTMEDWSRIHGIHYLGDLNKKISDGDYIDTIKICETLMENSFADAARDAINKKANIIFLNGPSSSGKTTSAYRLRIQLMVQGMFPLVVSMDNYFKDRKEIPFLPDGTQDFEHVDCVDLESFAEQMKNLICGKEVYMRQFDFVSGTPYYNIVPTKLPKNNILIIEGIHAFNPLVLDLFKDVCYYKLAINPLTLINIDHHNRLSSSDVRKMRRMVRDSRTRGASAEKTLIMWKNVRNGEEKNIFPYLENCDKMINTTLVYEVAALKKPATKALEMVEKTSDCYPEVLRLLNILSKVKMLPSYKDIPINSILREFIGD